MLIYRCSKITEKQKNAGHIWNHAIKGLLCIHIQETTIMQHMHAVLMQLTFTSIILVANDKKLTRLSEQQSHRLRNVDICVGRMRNCNCASPTSGVAATCKMPPSCSAAACMVCSKVPVLRQSPASKADVLSATPIKSQCHCHVTDKSANNLWRPEQTIDRFPNVFIKICILMNH